MNLKISVIKSAQWSTLGMVGSTTLQLVKFAVLARVLTPEEFGLIAIIMIVIAFSQAFMDVGISNAIILHKNITKQQLTNLYWLNIIIGVVAACSVTALSPLIADFFESADLMFMIMTIASFFILAAIGQQFRTLCQKELQFGTIALITLSAELMSTAIAIYLAWVGYGAWSLVFSSLLATTFTSIAFLVIGIKRHYRPTFYYKRNQLTGFFAFGLMQIGERVVNFLSANIDKILIGKMVGVEDVGFYNVAWQLIIFPLAKINPIVNSVAYPTYSKLQSEPERRERYYGASVRLLSIITIPLLIFLFFFAKEVVILVFGAAWGESSTLVKILVTVGLGKTLGNPGGALILSLGRADVGFIWNVFWALLITGGIFCTLSYKPTVESAAYMLLILSSITGLIWHYIVARIGNVNYWPIAGHIIKTLTASALIGFFTSGYVLNLNIDSNFGSILTGLFIFCIFYLLYLVVIERNFLRNSFRKY